VSARRNATLSLYGRLSGKEGVDGASGISGARGLLRRVGSDGSAPTRTSNVDGESQGLSTGARSVLRRVGSDGSAPTRTRKVVDGESQGLNTVRPGRGKAQGLTGPASGATEGQSTEDRLQSLLQGMDRARKRQPTRESQKFDGITEWEDDDGVNLLRNEGEDSLRAVELDEDLAEMHELMGAMNVENLKLLCKSRGIRVADIELCADREELMKLVQLQTLNDLPSEDLKLLCKARGISQNMIDKCADSQALALLALQAGKYNMAGARNNIKRHELVTLCKSRGARDIAVQEAGIFNGMTNSELQALCKARGACDADMEKCCDRQALMLLAQQLSGPSSSTSGPSLSVDELKDLLKSRGVSEDEIAFFSSSLSSKSDLLALLEADSLKNMTVEELLEEGAHVSFLCLSLHAFMRDACAERIRESQDVS
jgi:hypothetical protein